MFINKKQCDLTGNDKKHRGIYNKTRSLLFVEEKKGVRSQSKVHLLVMCQGFIMHPSLLVVLSFVTIIMGVFQMFRLNNSD
jgi:hypothetical protein